MAATPERPPWKMATMTLMMTTETRVAERKASCHASVFKKAMTSVNTSMTMITTCANSRRGTVGNLE